MNLPPSSPDPPPSQSGGRAANLALLSLTAAALYLCYLLAQPFLTAIAGAGVLAIAFYPFHKALQSRLANTSAAALISTTAVLLLVLVPALLIGLTAARELREGYGELSRRGADEGGLLAYLDTLLAAPIARVADWVGIPEQEIRDELFARMGQMGAAAVKFVTQSLASLGEGLFQGIAAFFTLFFLFRDGAGWSRRIAHLLPLDTAVTERIFSQATQAIIANLYGVVAVAGAQGFLLAVGFVIAGLPSPVLWGVVTAFTSLIPLVGSGAVWAPAAIILLASGSTGKAIFLAAWGAGLVSMCDNVVRPLVIGGRTHLNPLLIFFSLLGGIGLFGVVGLFLGPVIVSVTIVLLRLAEEQRPPRDSD
ncbi:MAG: AI-2E family transporter [Bryobacteraceae bacterium]